MIRGYFRPAPGQPRPFITAVVDVPAARRRPLDIDFLIDTGADRTAIAPYDAQHLGVDWSRVRPVAGMMGVGGWANTHVAGGTLSIDDVSINLQLTILSTPAGTRPLPLPSLLGCDILSRFCVVIDQATDRVLLLTPDERDRLRLP